MYFYYSKIVEIYQISVFPASLRGLEESLLCFFFISVSHACNRDLERMWK